MIPTRAVTSLLCQGMLMDIVHVVSSKSHFVSMSSEREREREKEFSKAAGTFCWGWIKAYK